MVGPAKEVECRSSRARVQLHDVGPLILSCHASRSRLNKIQMNPRPSGTSESKLDKARIGAPE